MGKNHSLGGHPGAVKAAREIFMLNREEVVRAIYRLLLPAVGLAFAIRSKQSGSSYLRCTLARLTLRGTFRDGACRVGNTSRM